MDEAFYQGYLAYMLSVDQPPHRYDKLERWAWDLGWRLHQHLMRKQLKQIQA